MRTVFLLACAALAGCTASAEDVAPPGAKFTEDDPIQIFFPTGIAVAPGEATAFVASGNSDLRYNFGTITALELETVDRIAKEWTQNRTVPSDTDPKTHDPLCVPDPDHTETLACDERLFFMKNVLMEIGNFATDVAIQDFGPPGNLRLIVPVRGDPSVTVIDWDGTDLKCTTSDTKSIRCDESHRLTTVHNDPDLALLPDEPFGAAAATMFDSTGKPVSGFAVVTHLTSGAVTLLDSPPGGQAEISDVTGGLFAADPLTGLRGSTGVAVRPPGDMIYVGSRSEDRIQMLTVGRPVNGAPPLLIPGNWFFLDFVGGNSGSSRDTRGMTFSPTGDRLYVVNREPPSLQIIDTSIGPTGFPKNDGIGATDICRQASTVAVADTGDGERAYVTCFQDGQLYVVDPRGLSQVEDIITVGRGPFAVAAAPTRKKIYVTNFLEDTIAVIDVDPTSPTRNRVVLRIGIPRAP